ERASVYPGPGGRQWRGGVSSGGDGGVHSGDITLPRGIGKRGTAHVIETAHKEQYAMSDCAQGAICARDFRVGLRHPVVRDQGDGAVCAPSGAGRGAPHSGQGEPTGRDRTSYAQAAHRPRRRRTARGAAEAPVSPSHQTEPKTAVSIMNAG